MTLTHITIPTAILRLKDLNLRQKVLLGLIISFNEKGLKMSNKALGEILDIWPSRVSKLLKDMESKGYIRIDNKQSQYRKIYLLQSAIVDEVLLATKRNSKNIPLATKRPSTVAQSRHRSKGSKEKRAHKTKKPVCDIGSASSLQDGAFDRFWDAYPKQQKRLKAQKAWKKLKPSPELSERIIKDVQRRSQTHDWQKENGKYVPMPENYLDDQRWTDVLPEPKRGDPDWLPDEQEADEIFRKAGITK